MLNKIRDIGSFVKRILLNALFSDTVAFIIYWCLYLYARVLDITISIVVAIIYVLSTIIYGAARPSWFMGHYAGRVYYATVNSSVRAGDWRIL